MARSKKDARNIVVHEVKYRWRAAGTDDGISLVVWPQDLPGPLIECSLDYHQIPVPIGKESWALTKQIVITNRLVRQVIEHAVRDFGYTPHTKGQQLSLGPVDKAIDLSNAVRGD